MAISPSDGYLKDIAILHMHERFGESLGKAEGFERLCCLPDHGIEAKDEGFDTPGSEVHNTLGKAIDLIWLMATTSMDLI
ncbi:hypothetical protein CsatB_000733 [Cannabis sativa]|uniref:Uncharacterized protein n=1 Tax=Cannabis sativa TaxID=3483 RepID=A0A7J6FT39_CANSA|nr:hypothetical protein G4B88_025136 [Cannabis sativa]KAF4372990.1 hypothetical protein F8388_011017 [Cannabis sativa]